MTTAVTRVPAASPEEALEHFERCLQFETDCWDTHDALANDSEEFVLLDVRTAELYRDSHVPGAVNLPHRKIIDSKLRLWPLNKLFVVYCAGPHCNGAHKAAVRLARLGRRVKIMIGGMTGWADEGFSFVSGDEPGLVDAA